MFSAFRNFLKSKNTLTMVQIPPSKIKKAGPVLVHDDYDKYLYERACQQEKLIELLNRGGEVYDGFNDLLFDVFTLLYKAEPELYIDAGDKKNSEFIMPLLKDKTILKTRTLSRFNVFLSLLGAIAYGEEFLKEAPWDKEKSSSGLGSLCATNFDMPGTGYTISTSHSAINSQISETALGLTKWGIGEKELERLSLEEVLRLTDLINKHPDFLRFAAQVGQVREMAKAISRTKMQIKSNRLSGITVNGDVFSALPGEMALLGTEATKPLFYEKVLSSRLLTYEHKNKQDKTQGPMVVLVDTSGSLHGENGYFAKAVVAALLDTAAREKRMAHVIVFSNDYHFKEFSFSPKARNPGDFVEMATLFYGQGTTIQKFLETTIKKLKEKAFERGHIVIVSDFIVEVEEMFAKTFLNDKKRLGFKIHSVVLESRDEPCRRLIALSDYVYKVNPLFLHMGKMANLFQNL